ncbi:hypothetical protein SPRG_19242 [Saprolegnia parasitica CBS 223.65]|uniref:Uncharacterized protein n=1 Tax=Saprolegnia parasitica (strain CBS 223.65) TaxID=695850 RepID=A0A067CWJ1_SAPPC|nr:hypothetical protein SPRG_19242 [Saprolegnia parasitica CBS 223.65]KDO33615.1 hypothetical protein SPRG_19242 [Saprolegnia parasitica CBS 223.65]|eukprot:XP_012195661.1 hypothetical protein SPRG_19242 [Saprolegnia parasitica CBS 223.65]
MQRLLRVATVLAIFLASAATCKSSSSSSDLLLEGVRLHMDVGALDEAKAIYARVVAENPMAADAWQLLGAVAVQEGDLPSGEIHFAHALALETDPKKTAMLHCNLAETRRLQKKHDAETLDHARTGSGVAPTEFCRVVLAKVLLDRSEPRLAIPHLQAVVAARDTHVEAWYLLGRAWLSLAVLDEAASAFHRLLAAPGPLAVEGYVGLGQVYQTLGVLHEAISYYQRALELHPTHFEGRMGLATARHQHGRLDDAMHVYASLLEQSPAHVGVLNNLGVALLYRGDGDAAAAYFHRALAIEPGQLQSLGNLYIYYADLGDVAAARAMAETAYKQSRNDIFRLQAALVLPPVYATHDQLLATRAALHASLDAFVADNMALSDFYNTELRPPFYLVYHGKNDRPLLEKLATLYRRAVPQLSWRAPHVATPRPQSCIRVGFMSKSFVTNHAHGLLLRGVLAGLDRAVYCVYLLVVPSVAEAPDPSLVAAVDHVVPLSLHLLDVQREVAALTLDVLVFADIMSDPVNYFTAFGRLARVQALFWGNPTTSGNAAIDYFVSSELLDAAMDPEETEDGDHYTEQVVLLPGLGIWYDPPPLPTTPGRRSDYNLDDHWTIYVCAQSVFKMQPEFDVVLAAILARDLNGHIVLVQGRRATWTAQLVARLRATLPRASFERLHLVPRVAGHEAYMRLLSIATVVLHPFPFGGSKTSAEALALGLPLVVRDATHLRARMAPATDAYIALALRLGTNATYHAEVAGAITARTPLLWRDKQVVVEWDRFLFNAVRLSALDET